MLNLHSSLTRPRLALTAEVVVGSYQASMESPMFSVLVDRDNYTVFDTWVDDSLPLIRTLGLTHTAYRRADLLPWSA